MKSNLYSNTKDKTDREWLFKRKGTCVKLKK